MRRATEFRRRRGQAMVEYLIIVPMLLMLVLGAVQFALLYQIKSTLNYATFMAARQGALSNAKKNSIKDALAAGMTPLFTFEPTALGLLKGRGIAMIEVFNPMTAKLEVLSPNTKMKDDFGITDPEGSGKIIIPNDHLMYRCSGTPCAAPVGGSSGVTVQDANILKIRVTYCAKLIVPLANVTIYSLANGIEGAKALTSNFFSTASNAATTPNMCSQLKDRFGDKASSLDSALSTFASGVGLDDDVTFFTDTLTDISNTLAGARVPGLDWGIGGYRIPITAEAVVRMQSPAKF